MLQHYTALGQLSKIDGESASHFRGLSQAHKVSADGHSEIAECKAVAWSVGQR
jgi:hypothetical protein